MRQNRGAVHAGDTEAIVAAAVQAGADADISALPEGYQTLLGPAFIDGTDLSLGQCLDMLIKGLAAHRSAQSGGG